MSGIKTRHLKQTVSPEGIRTITNSETRRFHCRGSDWPYGWSGLVQEVKDGHGAPYGDRSTADLHSDGGVHVVLG